jgi:hypothetical protein
MEKVQCREGYELRLAATQTIDFGHWTLDPLTQRRPAHRK